MKLKATIFVAATGLTIGALSFLVGWAALGLLALLLNAIVLGIALGEGLSET